MRWGRKKTRPAEAEDGGREGLGLTRATTTTTVTAGELPETDFKPFNWKKFFFTPKYIPFHILMILIVVATVIITIKHDQVVKALEPFTRTMKNLPAGWLIPIAILFIISFPPLFGHEIVGLLCGVVWGLWEGFLIVAAGTFIGEIGTWFAFKHLLRRKALKMERTNLTYGAMARLVRDGGFWIVLLIRFSVIPSHISTAVFSTCDVKFWHFFVATFLTLPKQIIIVYLGVQLGKTEQEKDNSTTTMVSNIVFAITAAMTIGVAVYVWIKMRKIKKALLEEQERRRSQLQMDAVKRLQLQQGQGQGQGLQGRERSGSDAPSEENSSDGDLAEGTQWARGEQMPQRQQQQHQYAQQYAPQPYSAQAYGGPQPYGGPRPYGGQEHQPYQSYGGQWDRQSEGVADMQWDGAGRQPVRTAGPLD